MTELTVLNEESISMSELRGSLKKIKKRDEELGFRANKAEEYLDSLSLLKEKETKELFAKIEKLKIPRFRTEYIFKIVDLLPTSPEEVKMILQGYPLTITAENVAKVAKVVKEYLPEKK